MPMERISIEKSTVLLTGASGFVGKIIYPILSSACARLIGICHTHTYNDTFIPVDICDSRALENALNTYSPQIIIHSAALRDPDACEDAPERAHDLHVQATAECAQWAAGNNAILVYISTDYVFNGEHPPYTENDPLTPLSVYGRTKALGEQAARQCPYHIIIRIPLQYGYSTVNDDSFLLKSLVQLNRGGEIRCDNTQMRSPTLSDDVGYALCDILHSPFTGTIHISGPSRMTRFDMMTSIADVFSYKKAHIIPYKNAHTPRAQRPKDSRLDTSLYYSCKWHACTPFIEGLITCRNKMKKDNCDWFAL